MKVHKIKLNIEFCDAVLNGEKTFEIMEDDRFYQNGDRIKFIPTTSGSCFPIGYETVRHPVADREYEITFVLHGWGIEEGYAALAIKEVRND